MPYLINTSIGKKYLANCNAYWLDEKDISSQTYKMYQCFKIGCEKKLLNLSCLLNHLDENHLEDFNSLIELKKAADAINSSHFEF